MIRATLAALAAFMLAGCATSADEKIFHALNALDQAQSINAISNDCYHETNPVTAGLFGEKPSAGEFVAYGLAISTALHFINRTDYMQEHETMRHALTAVAIVAKGYAVAENHRIGMRVSGSNSACAP